MPTFYPASQLAQDMGVKALLYSDPGSGKTPLMLSVPNAAAGISEPGLMSIRKTNFPCTPLFDMRQFTDWVNWVAFESDSARYDVHFLDSLTGTCNIALERHLMEQKHGLKAYGALGEEIYPLVKKLYFAKNRNIICICQQEISVVNGVSTYRPMFPGKALPIAIPHLFDEIWRLEKQPTGPNMIRTQGSYDSLTRDRSGTLQPLEPMNLDALFRKMYA